MFYTHVLRRALNELMPNGRGSNLAPNYDAEVFRARAANGTLTFQGRVLEDGAVAQLGNYLRRWINISCDEGHNLHWAKGFFFLHQIRGVKDSHPHPPEHRREALARFIAENGITMNTLRTDCENWRVDIGVEVMSEKGDSVFWRTDSHPHILHDVLGIPLDKAAAMTKMNHGRYYRDHTSHLTQLAGFRLTPGCTEGRGLLRIAKMQAYQTDKAITANPGEGRGYHAKHTTVAQLVDKGSPEFLNKLFDTFASCADQRVPSHARFEIRIPFISEQFAFVDAATRNWDKYLVAFPTEIWWCVGPFTVVDLRLI